MPRRKRTKEAVQKKLAKSGDLDRVELVAAVCEFFCQGYPATQIVELMKKEHGIEMSREAPYQLLSHAASRGWIRFEPPLEFALQQELREAHPWLQGVKVVHTSVFQDVGEQGARLLMELVRGHHRAPYHADEVHIGWAGGHAMRKVARSFAQLLHEPAPDLPEAVIFHAMVAGFNVAEPSTDPSAFFTYFLKDPSTRMDTRFVGLSAPALVHTEQLEGLQSLQAIKEAYDRADELDIIVTSAGLWSDEHSMLRRYMDHDPESLERLKKAGCIGDMLWRPLSDKGPIEIDTGIRAMTLVELSWLETFIEQGKHVLLVLGPCGGCNRPKARLLQALLTMEPKLMSHLVVDSRAAREVLSAQRADARNGLRTAI